MTEETIQEPIEPAATPSEPPAQQTDFAIPDDYKDKGWAAKVKSPDDLWKALDGAQQLIGKKSVVPEYNAENPDEFESFLNNLRPESADKYEFPDGVDDSIKSVYGEALHFAGVHPSKVNGVMEIVSKYEQAQIAEMQSPEKFDEMSKEAFGSDWQDKRDEGLAFLRQTIPETEKFLDALPNNILLEFYKMANYVNETYGKKQNGAQAGVQPTPPVVDLRAQADQLMDKILVANKKQPPDFDEVRRLNVELNEINNKRAKNESI